MELHPPQVFPKLLEVITRYEDACPDWREGGEICRCCKKKWDDAHEVDIDTNELSCRYRWSLALREGARTTKPDSE